MPPDDRRAAAVLVPLVPREGEIHLLFTERAQTLRDHAGQIAFPGGALEEGDSDPGATALREACEEIGLETGHVRILGRLSEFVTRTSRFHLTPVVAEVVQSSSTWRLNRDEVSAVFEIPLDHLADPANRGVHAYQRGGETRTSPAFFWDDHVIWGATADILVEFLGLLSQR
jgi:8-oxo-dGTP pyrophosphatase MutT (NUDIX family)